MDSLSLKDAKSQKGKEVIITSPMETVFSGERADDLPADDIMINDSIGILKFGSKIQLLEIVDGLEEKRDCFSSGQEYCIAKTRAWAKVEIEKESKQIQGYIPLSSLSLVKLQYTALPWGSYFGYPVISENCSLWGVKNKICILPKASESNLDKLSGIAVAKVSSDGRLALTKQEFYTFFGEREGTKIEEGAMFPKMPKIKKTKEQVTKFPSIYSVQENSIIELKPKEIQYQLEGVSEAIGGYTEMIFVDIENEVAPSNFLIVQDEEKFSTKATKHTLLNDKNQSYLQIDLNGDGQPELGYLSVIIEDDFDAEKKDIAMIGLTYSKGKWYQTSFDAEGQDGRRRY